LRAAGLTVRVAGAALTRGNAWADGQPVGVMHHHTALPVPFPVGALDGRRDGRVKCNLNTKPDGTVWFVAYRACNYSSGAGSKIVLDEVRNDVPPNGNAKERHLHDTTFGNRWFWNFENDHAGTGGPIPEAQYAAILVATEVVLDHFSLIPDNVISHAEWSARKVDPYWNNDRRSVQTIRDELKAGHARPKPPPPPPPTDWTKDLIMALPTLAKGDGFASEGKAHKRPDVKNAQGLLLAHDHKDENSATPETATDGWFGTGTDQSTRDFQAENHLSIDGVIGPQTWTVLLGQ